MGLRDPRWLVVFSIALGCGARRAPVPEESAQATSKPNFSPAPSASPAGPDTPATTARTPASAPRPCDRTSCDYKTEACCESEIGKAMSGCVKKPLTVEDNGHTCHAPLEKDAIGLECLRSSECPSPERCCANQGEDFTMNHCATACETAVACVPGEPGGCGAGLRCRPGPESRSGGICVVEAPRTACGTKTCSGATPICCYDQKTKRGRCFAPTPEHSLYDDPACPIGSGVAILQCTSPGDCAGEDCCAGGPVTATTCGGMCMSGIQTCRTVADCAVFMGPPTGCRADPELPFVKTCRYQGN